MFQSAGYTGSECMTGHLFSILKPDVRRLPSNELNRYGNIKRRLIVFHLRFVARGSNVSGIRRKRTQTLLEKIPIVVTVWRTRASPAVCSAANAVLKTRSLGLTYYNGSSNYERFIACVTRRPITTKREHVGGRPTTTTTIYVFIRMCVPCLYAVQTVVVRVYLIQCGTERARGFRTLTVQLRRIVVRRSLTRRFLPADKTMKIVRAADVIEKRRRTGTDFSGFGLGSITKLHH